MMTGISRGAMAVLAIALIGCSGDSESSKKRLIQTGNKYFDSGKYKEASLVYRKVINQDPRYGEAYYRWGLSELKQGRYAEALKALRRASELQPENDDAHSKLGDLYLAIYLSDTKRFKTVLTDFEELSKRLLKRNPKSFEGLRMKGYAAVANNDFKAAAEAFRAADQAKPNQGPVLLALAQVLVQDKQEGEAERVARAGIASIKYGPLYDFLYLLKFRDKNETECEALLKQKLAADPKSVAYWLDMAAHYVRFRKPDQMDATLREFLSKPDFKSRHRLVGDFYVRIGNLPAAYKLYEEGLKVAPEEKVTLQKKMVELLSMQGRHDEAVKLADQLLGENKTDNEARAIRAALRLRAGNKQEVDASIKEFNEVVKSMPDNPVVRFNLGEAHLAKGDMEAARNQFLEAIKLRPSYVYPKVALARIHLARREWTKALQYADEALQVNPAYPPARLARISSLIGLRDGTSMRSARAELDQMLERVPDSRDARYLLAMVDMIEGKGAAAEKGFLALRNANPPDVRGLFGLVEVYMATRRPDEARQLLEEEVKKGGNNTRGLRLALANVSVRSKDFDRALGEFKSLVQEYPQATDLWMRLGETYRLSRKLDDAIQSFDKAKQLSPDNPSIYLRLALAMEDAGRRTETRPLYEQILKMAPDNATALNNLAFIMAENDKDLDQALTYAQKAKQQLPDDMDVSDTLGWIYLKKNLNDDAIKVFRDLLQKKPEHVTWRYHLAMALFMKGDRLQARKELEAALKNKPRPDETQKINALLARIG